jgi:Mg2+ and Co2+ transporter CorA
LVHFWLSSQRANLRFAKAAQIIEQLSERIRQLEEQIKAERSQHAFAIEEMQKQIIGLLRDFAEERYKSARRAREKAFAEAPSPSGMKRGRFRENGAITRGLGQRR